MGWAHEVHKLNDALDRLQKKYPEIYWKGDWDDEMPVDDPDFQVVLEYRQKVQGNTKEYHLPGIDNQDVYEFVSKFPFIEAVRNNFGITYTQARMLIEKNTRLHKHYRSKRTQLSQIAMFDQEAKKVKFFNSMAQASNYIGVSRSAVKMRVQKRHGAPPISDRYQVKRRLWYYVDGGFD